MNQEARSGTDSRERLVTELCDRQHYFVVIFAFAVVFLLIQVPYLFVADSESALYVVVAMNVAGSAAFALGSGAVLRTCLRRD